VLYIEASLQCALYRIMKAGAMACIIKAGAMVCIIYAPILAAKC